MRAAIWLPPGAVAYKNPKQLLRILKLTGAELAYEGMDGVLILPHRVHQQQVVGRHLQYVAQRDKG